MQPEIKKLRAALMRAVNYIDSGRCNAAPRPIIKAATKSVDECSKSIVGDLEYSFNEACDIIGVGATQMRTYIKNGFIEPPQPIEHHKVVFTEAQLNKLKSTLEHKGS